MEITNSILLITGLIVILFGIGAIFNPNIAKWINAPGPPIIKALIATITGVILIIIGLVIQLPT